MIRTWLLFPLSSIKYHYVVIYVNLVFKEIHSQIIEQRVGKITCEVTSSNFTALGATSWTEAAHRSFGKKLPNWKFLKELRCFHETLIRLFFLPQTCLVCLLA